MSAEIRAVDEVLAGLIERGCTPAEALDYYVAEVGPETHTSWAEVRGVSQQAVSENVAKARAKLDES